MSVSYWLNLIGSFGLIGAGSLLGSVITVLIQHFLEKKKLKKERESFLQKEIYFNLQKVAEKLFKNLNLMRRNGQELNLYIKENKLNSNFTPIDIIKSAEELSAAQVYFPKETLLNWDHLVYAFNKVQGIYTLMKETKSVKDDEQKKNLKEANEIFDKSANTFREAILADIEKIRRTII